MDFEKLQVVAALVSRFFERKYGDQVAATTEKCVVVRGVDFVSTDFMVAIPAFVTTLPRRCSVSWFHKFVFHLDKVG